MTDRDDAQATTPEAARLAALRRYAIVDTIPEAAYDRIVRIAARIFHVPISLVSFIDADRQWFKARIGLELSETPRAIAFCNRTIESHDVLLVPDASRDPRFADNPLVQATGGIRFYAGAPLLTPDGLAVGTLCVVDTQPRASFSAEEKAALVDLAAIVMDQLELRLDIVAKQRDILRAGLRENLLEIAAEAPDFSTAIDAAMASLRKVTGGRVCLFFRVAPDGKRLQLIGSQLVTSPMAEASLSELRIHGMKLEDSSSAAAITAEKQIIFDRFTPELIERYPGIALSAGLGMHAQIITPLVIGEDKYTIVVAFGPEVTDLSLPAEFLRDAVSTLRPLLRRLRDLEEIHLFRRAVEASNDAVIISDAEPVDTTGPKIRYVNQAFLQQTGYTREEIIGQTPMILEGPETAPGACRTIRTALAAHLPVRQDILTYRRDGSTFWSELSIAPLANPAGWYTHWVAIQRDVTAQKAEGLALAASEASFRYFFEAHPAPMWVYDTATLAFLEVNDAAVATYGWSREAFLGMNLLDVIPEKHREAVRSAAAKPTFGYADTGPWRHLTASGAFLTVQVRSQTVDFRGRKAGLVAIWDLTERIKAEETARELTARLHATMESISDIFYTLDGDWRFTYANEETTRVLRCKPEDLVGQNIWEIFPDAIETELFERYHRVVRSRATERFPFFYGPLASWFDVAVYPAADGLTIFFRDITQERSRGERLRLLETAVDKLNDVILITEARPVGLPGPRIIFVNAAFERLTGFSATEVRGQTPRILQGPDTNRAELDRIHAALEAWRPVRAEVLNYKKSGEEIWFELDIVPVADESGRYTHWVSVERDVTERKRAQILLERQAALLDQARDAILVRDMDHRIQYWNRSAERLYGWSREEAVGLSVVDLIYAEPAEFNKAMAALMAQGYWSGRLKQRRKDGGIITAEVNWTLVRDKDGTANAVLAVIWDMTERLALENQLRQSQRLEAVGQLTGGIAHDFNNLLTVILGNGEMLMDSLAGNDDLRPMAEVTVAAAERGAALISRLLAFSRRQALDPKVIDVNRLLVGLGQLLHRTIGEQVKITLIPAIGLWNALIDPPQLEAAVLNLVINARDAMPAGGNITIETCNARLDAEYASREREVLPGEYVVIAVSDQGTGMTPEVLAQAFEPFFTTKEVGQGSGLGLSMVYGFAKQSGGHVKIICEPSQGTVVKMYFPRASALLSGAAAQLGLEQPRGGTEHLLLVEDEALVREHVAQQLRALGYRVTTADSGAQALEVLHRDEYFDLLFTDVVMPGGMTGPELATHARRLRPHLRVLFTSGYTEDTIVHHGRLDPGVTLLEKPYRRRELAEKIRLTLDATA